MQSAYKPDYGQVSPNNILDNDPNKYTSIITPLNMQKKNSVMSILEIQAMGKQTDSIYQI